MQIIDTSDPSSRSSSETEEFAHFKRDIYQKVLKIIFQSLRHRSHDGEIHRCADGISRILYPGILIESQDAEEAAYFCGCRAARATHPCPKCLVSHSELHKIFENFELRTPNNMRAALRRVASAGTKAERQRILVKYGLHDIPVRLLYLQVLICADTY
jgi:Plavaka transposase